MGNGIGIVASARADLEVTFVDPSEAALKRSEEFLKKWEQIWPHMVTHRFEDSGHYILEDSFKEVRSKIEPFLFGD